jgi:hypothetical protein
MNYSSAQKIYVGSGPEDMVLDKLNNRLLISCAERKKGKPNFEVGEIISLDFTTLLPIKMIRTGLYADEQINPHGIDLIKIDGKQLLYVISHAKGNKKHYVFIYEVKQNELNCINRFTNELFLLNPNDITVSQDGYMYITNEYGFKLPGLFLNWLFKRKTCQVTCITPQGRMFFLINDLAGPNGILFKDGKLYVAITRTGEINEYQISESNEKVIGHRTIAYTGLYPDNITLQNDTTITVACHQSAWKVIKYFLNSEKHSGFSVFSISLIENNEGNSKIIFENDGELISGVSTAIVNDSKLILSQFMGDFIMILNLTK